MSKLLTAFLFAVMGMGSAAVFAQGNGAAPIAHPPIIASPAFVVPRPDPGMRFWANLLPQGSGRSILQQNCQFCHDLQRAVAFVQTKEEWRQIVETMHARGSPIPDRDVPVLVDYLSRNFGPASSPIAGPDWAVKRTGIKPCTRAQWPKGSADFRRNWRGSYNIWVSDMQGGDIDVVDPVTLHIADNIKCVSSPDRVEFSRHGDVAYVPDRVEDNVTVIDTQTGAIKAKIPLIARPNTSVLSRDYKRLYVAIWPLRPQESSRGYVQVIDTRTLKVVKTFVTKGAIHDPWMSPDGKVLLAMSPVAHFMNVYDTDTGKLRYTCCTDAEIGTMAIESHPDGSTWRFFIGYQGFHGIVVIDANTGRELKRVPFPRIKGTLTPVSESVGFHGGEISPDGRNLWVMDGNTVWRYELPGVKYLGNVPLTRDDQAGNAFTPPFEGTWLTISPDGRRVYAVRGPRALISVIDVRTMKEVAQVPTGEYPLHISIWPRGTP